MAVKYEWKETRGGGRRFVRTVVPDEPKAAPNGEPVAVIEPEPIVEEAEVIEPPKPKRGRPRKVATDD